MAPALSEHEKWVSSAVTALQDAGSWTGRTHVHKLRFLLETLSDVKTPFEFELYHFGPYSRDLDGVFAEMSVHGHLDLKYECPGYGPRYSVASSFTDCLSEGEEKQKVERLAQAIGKRNSRELELMATCLWVERREGTTEDGAIVSRVKKLKPKYDTQEIEEQLEQVRKLASDIAA